MFLCFVSEHSLRVSTSPEIQEDLPVPGGPATMIPKRYRNSMSREKTLDMFLPSQYVIRTSNSLVFTNFKSIAN